MLHSADRFDGKDIKYQHGFTLAKADPEQKVACYEEGSLENLIDLSVASDNITFLDEAVLANSTRTFEDILAPG